MKSIILSSSLLIATAAANAFPQHNLLPRATNRVRATNSLQSACSSSLDSYESSIPTPTDRALSSWLAARASITTTVTVPSNLASAYCKWDGSVVSFAKATVVPYYSRCSSALDADARSDVSDFLRSATTTQSECSAYTSNAAARETARFGAGVAAAAGLVAAIL